MGLGQRRIMAGGVRFSTGHQKTAGICDFFGTVGSKEEKLNSKKLLRS
jgi:hypothetical protein